jgi:DNA helicase-2/ATP-dependent DNA helicase PcrA
MPVDLSHLNPEQRQAAEHVEGPLLVLAGAGSGKTRVLVTRIAKLIEDEGVDPSAILALTFTNKAAQSMRDRVRVLLDREPSGMWIGTFHAIGARMLRRDATRLGWAPNFLVYDADDQESLVKRIVKDDLQLDPKRWPPKAFQSAISKAKNELVSVQAYAEAAVDVFERKTAEVYARYQQALRDANAFDFDDLLVKPVELLRNHPAIRQRYQDRFAFVLVDEYQDTNHAQYVLLKLLVQETAEQNLFVVGDDDQSIYGWRGADIRNILDFEKDFPTAGVVRLETNYRSTGNILDAANQVIARNLRRKGKTLRTDAPAGDLLTLVEAADEGDEAEWVARDIRARMDDDPHLTLRDFVVLYRTNAQSRAMEEALLRERLGYRVIGGTRFYERREVKDALAYLRLVANPAANEAFNRIVNVPKRGLGDTSIAKLAAHAAERGIPLLAAAAEAERVPGLKGAAAKTLGEFAAFIQKHAALARNGIPLGDLLESLISQSGLVAALEAEGPEAADRVDNVRELAAGASDLQQRLDAGDPDLLLELEEMGDAGPQAIDLFLSHVALVADIDQHDPTVEAVSLMTLHNAKGLEFPVVYISGLEDGLFPLSRTFDEPEQLEEERRLFYVGITRAERTLTMLYAKRRRRGGEYMDSMPSSFLEGVPSGLLVTRQTMRASERVSFGGFGRPWRQEAQRPLPRRQRLGFDLPAFGSASSASPASSADAGDGGYEIDYSDSQDTPRLTKGTRVRHPQFGAGSVAEITGTGADVRATIDFDEVGRKKIILKYANLEREWD